jgi:hypothetical protein
VVTRVVETSNDTAWVISRTSKGKDAKSVRKNPLRVTCDVHIGGYFLEAVSPSRTRVTYVLGGDLNGVFALDWMARKAGPQHFKGLVGYHVKYAKELKGEEEEEEGVKGALDMGSIFANDEEEGAIEMTENVAARNVVTGEKMSSPLHVDAT